MIEISNAAAPLLVQALRDAVRYNEELLKSETLRNRSEYEEHLVEISQFYAEVKAQYKKQESEIGIPLDEII
ncbi:uncharacterized protein sS8_0030 [Methylocaldum marinum]|uniref:Uncharacterized protein n=1 Tax=Methylocaldum marinum TaxID=1432792 RepID=A0A286T7T6_9GAMM|nr:hypothetical protein [Methylocaldum marinum]BBA32000.1 uncharacterized protein sS8_0030 [Methylocaldum marinum]